MANAIEPPVSTAELNTLKGSNIQTTLQAQIDSIGSTLSLDNGKIFIGNASNVPIDQTLSGDVTITNTGVATLTSKLIDVLTFTCNADSTALTGSYAAISGMVAQSKALLAGTYLFFMTWPLYCFPASSTGTQFSTFINSTEVACPALDTGLNASSAQVRSYWTTTSIVLTAATYPILPHAKQASGNGLMDTGYVVQIAIFKTA